jgi:hypothetical protein
MTDDKRDTLSITLPDGSTLDIPVGTDEEIQQVKYLICAPASMSHFKDDLIGPCTICGKPVCYRPYMPKHLLLVCLDDCFPKLANPS